MKVHWFRLETDLEEYSISNMICWKKNLSLSIFIHRYPFLLFFIQLYPSIFIFIHPYPSLSIFIQLYPSLFIFFHFYPNLFISIHPYPSLPIVSIEPVSLPDQIKKTANHFIDNFPEIMLQIIMIISFNGRVLKMKMGKGNQWIDWLTD